MTAASSSWGGSVGAGISGVNVGLGAELILPSNCSDSRESDGRGESQLVVRFEPIRPVHGEQTLGYRTTATFLDSRSRLIPYSQLISWAGSSPRRARLQSYRLQETWEQAGARLDHSRLFLPVEVKLFLEGGWSWPEVADRAARSRLPAGQLVWEVLESEALGHQSAVRRFMSGGREFFSRFGVVIAADRSPDWQLVRILRPEFLILPARLIAGCAADQHRRARISDWQRQATDLGISLIALGVEQPADWEWIGSAGIFAGCGPYCGAAGPLPGSRLPKTKQALV